MFKRDFRSVFNLRKKKGKMLNIKQKIKQENKKTTETGIRDAFLGKITNGSLC